MQYVKYYLIGSVIWLLAAVGSLLPMKASAANNLKKLIPAIQSGFYYQMGGGNDIPLPAYFDISYLPLNVSSDTGLGFDCGVFNPVNSITDSLNEIKNSSLNIENQVLQNATAAVTEFPLYELSRADPNLYNIITSAMSGAREDMQISTKSCQVMQSEIGAGEDPYAYWGQIALGHRWQQAIGTAALSGHGDINQAHHAVAEDAGKSGVPWVNPNAASSEAATQTYYAGGVNQAPIRVLHDTAMVGYQVVIGDNTNFSSQHGLKSSASELTSVFPTAKAAADWVTDVVGDETITTYNGGKKSSKPGAGLYPAVQYEMQQILPKLQDLVIGTEPLSVTNLADLSPQDMALSPEIIRAIRRQPKVIQSIMTDKLAQNIAAMVVINKARLAMEILQSGERVPAIYSNKAARQNIKQAISQLQQEVKNILLFVKARQTLMSHMLSTILQAGATQTAENTAITLPKQQIPVMQHGAVSDGK